MSLGEFNVIYCQSKFGESNKTPSEELFGTVSKFIVQFSKVHKELFPPPKLVPQ